MKIIEFEFRNIGIKEKDIVRPVVDARGEIESIRVVKICRAEVNSALQCRVLRKVNCIRQCRLAKEYGYAVGSLKVGKFRIPGKPDVLKIRAIGKADIIKENRLIKGIVLKVSPIRKGRIGKNRSILKDKVSELGGIPENGVLETGLVIPYCVRNTFGTRIRNPLRGGIAAKITLPQIGNRRRTLASRQKHHSQK
jgi:hypothetical protein